MTTDVLRWQRDAHNAFEWLATMYAQAQTLWEDAERYFQEARWVPNAWGGFGGIAMSQSDMREWPFFYLKGLSAVPKDADLEYPSTLPIFGISFYDHVRPGPVLYAGCWRWAKEPTRGHWLAYYALTLEGDRFQRSHGADGPLKVALPTDLGRKKYPGIEEVRWFEVPLGAVSTGQQLKAIVGASIAMAKGDDAAARDIAGSQTST